MRIWVFSFFYDFLLLTLLRSILKAGISVKIPVKNLITWPFIITRGAGVSLVFLGFFTFAGPPGAECFFGICWNTPACMATVNLFFFIIQIQQDSAGFQTTVQIIMDQISRLKTPNPKCRLYWCLLEFKDWRYSQSCWYFLPLLWTRATLSIKPSFWLIYPPPPRSLCE